MHFLLRRKLFGFLRSLLPFWLVSMVGQVVNIMGRRLPFLATLFCWFVSGIIVKAVAHNQILCVDNYKGIKIVFPGRNWSSSLA